MAQRPPDIETVSNSAALPQVTKDPWEIFAVRRRGRGDSQNFHAHIILKTIDNDEVATQQTSRLQTI